MSFTKQNQNGVVFHTADAFTAAGGVAHGFATRLGGVSTGPYAQLNLGITRPDERAAVRENYHRFCAAIGVDETRLVMTHQVHEDGIRVATAADVLPDLLDPIDYRVDGLVTNTPGLALTIYYADCIPVLLYDPVGKAIAAVHSGWRGTSLGIAPKAVAKMTALYGTRPEDVLAAIGPGIGPCCFETHADVPDRVGGPAGAGGPALLPPPGTGGGQVHRGPQGHHRLGTAPGGAGRGTHRHLAPVHRLPPGALLVPPKDGGPAGQPRRHDRLGGLMAGVGRVPVRTLL